MLQTAYRLERSQAADTNAGRWWLAITRVARKTGRPRSDHRTTYFQSAPFLMEGAFRLRSKMQNPTAYFLSSSCAMQSRLGIDGIPQSANSDGRDGTSDKGLTAPRKMAVS
jgi:hypothetical protein